MLSFLRTSFSQDSGQRRRSRGVPLLQNRTLITNLACKQSSTRDKDDASEHVPSSAIVSPHKSPLRDTPPFPSHEGTTIGGRHEHHPCPARPKYFSQPPIAPSSDPLQLIDFIRLKNDLFPRQKLDSHQIIAQNGVRKTRNNCNRVSCLCLSTRYSDQELGKMNYRLSSRNHERPDDESK